MSSWCVSFRSQFKYHIFQRKVCVCVCVWLRKLGERDRQTEIHGRSKDSIWVSVFCTILRQDLLCCFHYWAVYPRLGGPRFLVGSPVSACYLAVGVSGSSDASHSVYFLLCALGGVCIVRPVQPELLLPEPRHWTLWRIISLEMLPSNLMQNIPLSCLCFLAQILASHWRIFVLFCGTTLSTELSLIMEMHHKILCCLTLQPRSYGVAKHVRCV